MDHLDITAVPKHVAPPRSLVTPIISPRRYSSYVPLGSSTREPSNCLEEERCAKLEDDAQIDSKFANDGSIIEYKDKVDELLDSLRQRELTMILLLF